VSEWDGVKSYMGGEGRDGWDVWLGVDRGLEVGYERGCYIHSKKGRWRLGRFSIEGVTQHS